MSHLVSEPNGRATTPESPAKRLPHVTLCWDSRPGGGRVQSYDGNFGTEPGLTLKVGNFKPRIHCVQTPEHFVVVIGSPILGKRIDPEGACRACLMDRDPAEVARSLNGEFLLVHLDRRANRLRIINDRFASFPLYHAQVGSRWLGSIYYSDLWKALRDQPGWRVNSETFFEFLCLQRVFGTKTYDSLSAFLPSAVVFESDGGSTRIEKYWRHDFTKVEGLSLEDWADRLIQALRQSIARKTSDGVRYGLFLSGGMDTRTILAAFPTPPVCFTVGFTENNEVRVGRAVAQMKGEEHHYVPVRPDYFEHYLDHLVQLGGGMYVYDHALFFGLEDVVGPRADVVFHGHGMDYLFQGMYLPTYKLKLFGHQTYLRWLRRVDADLVGDFLATISYRLKYVDPYRYVRPQHRDRLRGWLRAAIQEVVEEARDSHCQTPYDVSNYIMTHALSRHYSNCNISDLVTAAEQRTITFENDLFGLYLRMPVRMRFAAAAMRRALRKMHPALADYPSANTGMRIDLSPLEQELNHLARRAAYALTRNPTYRHPRAADRTWPYRNDYLRASSPLRQALVDMSRSEALADALPYLDMDTLKADVDAWLAQAQGGGDLMATLLTVDRFLKQT